MKKTTKYLFYLFLGLGAVQVSAQADTNGSKQQFDLDSLYQVTFAAVGPDKVRSKAAANLYLNVSAKRNAPSHYAYALDLKGMDAYNGDILDSAFYYSNLAIEAFRKLNDSSGLSMAIYNKSIIHEYLGEYKAAFQALHLARSIDFNLGEQNSSNAFYFLRLSDIVYGQNQLELALRYLHKAWEAQRATGNFHDYLIPTMHINYAWIYADIEAIELAEYHAKKAYSFTKIDSLTEVRSGALQVLSYLAEQIGDAELSLNYAKKALKLDRTMNNAYSIAYSEGFLMEVYQGMGRMAEAGILAVSIESALDDYADNPNFAADINEYLYNFYKAQGDAEKALNHLEAATKAKATLNSVDSETVMDQFDAEMKARVEEIGITKTRLQEEKLKFRTILLIASLIALAGVIIFLIFLYASNRKIASVNNLLKERSAVIHDQKKEIEYQKNILTERNQDLEKLNDSKDRLFSILTHDLKQPFNQITGFIDLIKEGMINENERNQLLMDLKASVANTSSLVTNVLLWSKAQFAGVTVAPKELILANTVKRALLHFSMALDKKGIKVVFEIPENLKIVFDQDHFASVLRNIFSNAYKFSPADATIYISATTDRLLKRAYLSIRDEGVGIDPEQRDKLLNASNTESLSGTFNEMGTGIGMIIVNDFLRENGGSFDIETGLDKGSTFIINLPLSKGTPGSSESKTLSIKSKY